MLKLFGINSDYMDLDGFGFNMMVSHDIKQDKQSTTWT